MHFQKKKKGMSPPLPSRHIPPLYNGYFTLFPRWPLASGSTVHVSYIVIMAGEFKPGKSIVAIFLELNAKEMYGYRYRLNASRMILMAL